jgi:monoterpene epsilon-lactone hydrolase
MVAVMPDTGTPDTVTVSRRARAARRSLRRLMGSPDRTLEQRRRSMDRIDRFPRPRRAAYADIVIGGVPAIRAVPKRGVVERHVLYLHGGGYVVGSPKSHIAMATTLALRCAAATTVIDYRLAPEHPYPAAIDDCVAAYRALVTTNGPETIAIAGDSAGGGATLATLVRLRDEGIPLPACAYVISPWTDLTASGASVTSRAASDPMIDAAAIVDTARRYAGAAPLDDPGVSPLFADLTGLPPLLVHVGDDEVLLDDSIRLAERARAAGVEVELEVYHGLWHVFHAFAGLVPEATSALRAGSAFIARHAGRPPA